MNMPANPDSFNTVTMSSRDIADLCEKRHDHVLRDIRAYVGAILQMERGLDVRSLDWSGKEGVQVFGETPIGGVTAAMETNPQNGQSYPVYHLDKSATLTVVSGYNVLLRKRIIDRWLELEAGTPADPLRALNDPATMRGLLLTYSEKVLALEAKVGELSEKGDALDRIATADGSLSITEAAKALQMRPKDLFSWLRANGWIYRRAGASHRSRLPVEDDGGAPRAQGDHRPPGGWLREGDGAGAGDPEGVGAARPTGLGAFPDLIAGRQESLPCRS